MGQFAELPSNMPGWQIIAIIAGVWFIYAALSGK